MKSFWPLVPAGVCLPVSALASNFLILLSVLTLITSALWVQATHSYAEPLTDPAPVQQNVPEAGKNASSAAIPVVKPSLVPIPVVGWRWDRELSQMYVFEDSPLGERTPVILVPGRAEEYQHHSWWKRFRKDFDQDKRLPKQSKLYVFLYDSKLSIEQQAKDFAHELQRVTGLTQKPVILITYSLGGVIAREALESPELFQRVSHIFALAVPFHGSPIFDPEWYNEHIQHVSPIRALWDKLAYNVYLWDKTNLTRGLRWDNFDCSKPQYLSSEIKPLGDTLVVNQTEPYEERPTTEAYKAKTIVYASYLENKYTQPYRSWRVLSLKGLVNGTRSLPKAIIGSLLPAYGLTAHDVFTYTNDQLSNLTTFTPQFPEGKNIHLYKYNDGTIPLSSMLYLPARCEPYSNNLEEMIQALDVQKARIFVNIDHVDLGHYRWLVSKSRIRAVDVLHAKEGRKFPNDWLLYDLKALLTPTP